jgi:hypothetical protein
VAEEARVTASPTLLDHSNNGIALAAKWIVVGLSVLDVVGLLGFLWLVFTTDLSLEGRFAVNKWVALVIGVVVVAPLMLGIKHQFELMARKQEPSTRFIVAMSAYACVFFGAMFWITKDLYFDHSTGESLQFYGVSLDGRIQLYGSDGFDTTTGDPLRKVTKQIIFAYEQQEAGLSPVAVSLADFQQRVYDGTTGATRVWYARHPDGHFSLYDRPGFDAILGIDLKPVTQEVANEIRGWIDRRTQADSQRAAAAALEVERSAQREKAARAEAARLAFIERYIDRNSRRVAGMSNVAVRLIESGDANSESVASAMDRALRDRGFNVVPLFKPEFGREGLDRQLFDGSPSLALRLELAQHCDSIVIGSVRMVRAPRSAGGMYITEMALQLKQISAAGIQMNQAQVQEKGGALDASSSVSAAIEKLAASAEATMAAWPST